MNYNHCNYTGQQRSKKIKPDCDFSPQCCCCIRCKHNHCFILPFHDIKICSSRWIQASRMLQMTLLKQRIEFLAKFHKSFGYWRGGKGTPMKLKHRIAPSVYDVCLRATMLQETSNLKGQQFLEMDHSTFWLEHWLAASCSWLNSVAQIHSCSSQVDLPSGVSYQAHWPKIKSD